MADRLDWIAAFYKHLYIIYSVLKPKVITNFILFKVNKGS